MTSIRTAAITVAITGLVMLGLMSQANAYSGQRYAKQVHVTLQQARDIALKEFPGKIVSEELEKEAGGSGLRYSFRYPQQEEPGP